MRTWSQNSVIMHLITVCVSMCSSTWHTDAGVISYLVQAGGIILAGVGATFIDVLLTAWAVVTRSAVTAERALCVLTRATMLTWVWPWWIKKESQSEKV